MKYGFTVYCPQGDNWVGELTRKDGRTLPSIVRTNRFDNHLDAARAAIELGIKYEIDYEKLYVVEIFQNDAGNKRRIKVIGPIKGRIAAQAIVDSAWVNNNYHSGTITDLESPERT